MVLISDLYWTALCNKQNKAGFFITVLYFSESLVCSCALRLLEGNLVWNIWTHFFEQETTCLYANHLRGRMLQLDQRWETLFWWLRAAESPTGSPAFTSLAISFLFGLVPIPPATQSIHFLSVVPFSCFLPVQICGALILNELLWRGA